MLKENTSDKSSQIHFNYNYTTAPSSNYPYCC